MLFDKVQNGSEELNSLTGQWFASTPFYLIRTEIDFAAQELGSIVGSEVVDAAEEAYLAGADPDFVDAVRLPVAFRAIARYAQLSGVSHEGTGRKVKMDDNEKMPFEWMIDRDDRAMLDRYYRALDALYRYLEKNEVASWISSPMRALTGRCIVRNLNEFERFYPVGGSSYAFHLFVPLIVEAQENAVEPFVGEEVWKRIYPEVAESDETAMRLRSRAALLSVLTALVTAARRWSLDILPLSVARRFSPSYQGNRESRAAETKEIDWFIDKTNAQIAQAKDELKKLAGASGEAELLPKNDPANKFATVV
nr:MAG TPA: hypothetical protein [Caudoviricetes sp.]